MVIGGYCVSGSRTSSGVPEREAAAGGASGTGMLQPTPSAAPPNAADVPIGHAAAGGAAGTKMLAEAWPPQVQDATTSLTPSATNNSRIRMQLMPRALHTLGI